MLETALIVEDEVVVARAYARVLKPLNVVATNCRSLAEARQWIDAVAVPPLFVILDLQLPDGDGAKLLARLRALRPRPLVIVISGKLDAARVLSLYGQCLISLPKPVGEKELGALVRLVGASRSAGGIVDKFAADNRLTPKETSLLRCAVRGLNNPEAADELGTKLPTVNSHWNHIFEKSGFQGQRDVIVGLLWYCMEVQENAISEGPVLTDGPVRKSGVYRKVTGTAKRRAQ